MKKILLFLFLPFLLVACSSDEPTNESEYVDSSSSNSEVFDNITLTFEPFNKQAIKERYCDIICVVDESTVAVPLYITVELKDGTSINAPFTKKWDNLNNLGEDYLKSKRYGIQSYGEAGFNNISFSSIKEINFLYTTMNEDGKQVYKTVILYGDGKKCNKVLRSLFK